MAQPPNHYTIQVIGLSTQEKLKALIEGHENLAPWAIYTVQAETRPIHVLVQGNYPTVEQARTARDNFPRAISKPGDVWIRQFVKVQELISAQASIVESAATPAAQNENGEAATPQ